MWDVPRVVAEPSDQRCRVERNDDPFHHGAFTPKGNPGLALSDRPRAGEHAARKTTELALAVSAHVALLAALLMDK